MYKSGMSRRDFVAGVAAAPMSAAIRTNKSARRPPNLLFLWTDEQRADTMSVYGNRKIHAPALNRLAGNSFVLQNAYVSQPVCTPSRSTVMTGLWPHTTGCRQNNIPLPEQARCFPELLADSDCRTGYFGKWHLGDEIFAQHGFEEWRSTEDGYRKFYRSSRDQTKKSDYWHFLKGLGYEPDSEGDYSRNFAARRPIDHCKPKFLEREACHFLDRHQRDRFVLYVNFMEPHMPFFGPLNDEYDPAAVDLPANFSDPLEEDEPLRDRLIREGYLQTGQDGIELKEEAGWRRLIANYWGLVTLVDRSVGEILKTLETLGLAENTIVVYTSDHGDMMGSHRLVAKTVMYEEAVRVPWLMRVPWLKQAQRLIQGNFSQIDLVPTLLDLMGRPVPESLPGRSLLPILKGERRQEGDVFIQWNAAAETLPPSPQIPAVEEDIRRAAASNTRTVITKDGWKLCLRDGDKSQLFDLRRDRAETQNLFYSGEHREVIRNLERRIQAWQAKVRDPLRIDTPSL